MGRKQASKGIVMLWAMLCWKTLDSAICVDASVPDHLGPFIKTMFSDACGLFQQDNVLCHKAKVV